MNIRNVSLTPYSTSNSNKNTSSSYNVISKNNNSMQKTEDEMLYEDLKAKGFDFTNLSIVEISDRFL